VKAQKFAQKKEALERIVSLFDLAKKDPRLAKKYVLAARKLAMRNKVRLPESLRGCFCKNCNAFLKLGVNCSVRKRAGVVVIRCLECQSVKRLGVR